MGGGGLTEGGEDERGQNHQQRITCSSCGHRAPKEGMGRVSFIFASLKFSSVYAASLVAARARAVLPSLCVCRTSSSTAGILRLDVWVPSFLHASGYP